MPASRNSGKYEFCVMPLVRNTGAIGSHMHTTVVTLFWIRSATVAWVCSVACSMSDS